MFAHRHSFAVLTSGLMIAVGTSSGCQLIRDYRNSETTRFRSYQADINSFRDESFADETYIPESEIVAPNPSRSSPAPSLRLPPEPALPQVPAPDQRPQPAPPAVESDAAPQARWRPAQPHRYSSVSNENSFSQNQYSSLPSARVTYNAEEQSTSEPVITPAPTTEQTGQPRLFQPAGSVKSMFDSVKRKLSR